MPFFAGGSDPNAAQNLMGTETGFASQFGDRGGSSWNSLFPTLKQEISKPTGYTTSQKASMNTAAQQGLGGSVAGIAGEGALMAGRTRNPGSYGAALDASAAGAQRRESQAALGVEEASANIAQQKQQDALRAMGSLYGLNVEGLSSMLRNANESLSTYEGAKEHQSSVMGDLGQIGQVGGEFASALYGGGGGFLKH